MTDYAPERAGHRLTAALGHLERARFELEELHPELAAVIEEIEAETSSVAEVLAAVENVDDRWETTEGVSVR